MRGRASSPRGAILQSPAVTAWWLRPAGPWLSWPICGDGDQSDWPGIALGPNWGSGRCFGQDVDRCRLLFLLGYAGARAFVAGRGTDPPGPARGVRGAGPRRAAHSRADAGKIVLCRRPLPRPQAPTAPQAAQQPTPQQQVPQRDVAILDGVLERVTFSNPETGYTIARIAPDRGTGRGPVSASTELITAVGPLLGAQIGESLRLRGRWTSHMKYGRQFDVHSYTTVLPATEQGIRRYLESGLIKGIGPVMAERMVYHFGVDIMHIIDDEPGRLIEVPGLGPKRSTRIKDAWAEQKAIKQVMIFLQGVGVSTSLAVKIYKSTATIRNKPSSSNS